MSDPKDTAGQTGPTSPDLTPQGNAPSWVDEVLGSSRAAPDLTPPSTPLSHPLSGPEDLKLPQTQVAPPPPPEAQRDDDWVSAATRGQVKNPQMPSDPTTSTRHTQASADVLRDFVRPLTQSPTDPAQSPVPISPAPMNPAPLPQGNPHAANAWGENQPSAYTSESVSQRKLIAGLLAIFLGSFGIHKFYLGMNTAGLIMLGVNVGVWILAFLLGFITLGLGLFITLPLASIVSGGLGVLGLVEGIIYLTKSDADFQREYIIGKKPWL